MVDINDLLARGQRRLNKPKKLGKETTAQKVEEFDLIKEGEKLLGKDRAPIKKPEVVKVGAEGSLRGNSKIDTSNIDVYNSDYFRVPAPQDVAQVQQLYAAHQSNSDASESDTSIALSVERDSADTNLEANSTSDLDAAVLDESAKESASVPRHSAAFKSESPMILDSKDVSQVLETCALSPSNSDVSESDASHAVLVELNRSDVMLEAKAALVADSSISRPSLVLQDLRVSDSDTSLSEASEMDVSNLDASMLDFLPFEISNKDSSVNTVPEPVVSKTDVSNSDASQSDVADKEISKPAFPKAQSPVIRAGTFKSDITKHAPVKPIHPQPSFPSARAEADVSEADVSKTDLSDMRAAIANADVEEICEMLRRLAGSQLGLREIRAAIYLLAKAKGQKNVEFQYSNPELSEATNCHTSHMSGVMSALDEGGFLSKRRGKGNEKSSFTLR